MPSGPAGWIVLGAVAAAAAFALALSPAPSPPVGRGSAAPDFELPLLDGAAPVVLSDFRGRVVLVNFWATWCKPCEDEMPAMERLYRELAPEGLTLLAISVGETPEVVRPFLERMGVTFPVLLDGDRAVAGRWQTFAYPESLLVDRDGTVLERYVGPRDWDAPLYVERIRRALRGDEPVAATAPGTLPVGG